MASPVFLFDAEDSLYVAVIGHGKRGDPTVFIVRLTHALIIDSWNSGKKKGEIAFLGKFSRLVGLFPRARLISDP